VQVFSRGKRFGDEVCPAKRIAPPPFDLELVATGYLS
jgi:hypothetical protein